MAQNSQPPAPRNPPPPPMPSAPPPPQQAAAPQYYQVPPAQQKATLSNWSWWGILVMSALTGGLFIPIWYFIWRDRLNQMNSQFKLTMSLLIWIFVLLVVSHNVEQQQMNRYLLSHLDNLSFRTVQITLTVIYALCALPATILMIIAAFRTKAIIQQATGQPVSGAATFFFGPMYLQQKLRNGK